MSPSVCSKLDRVLVNPCWLNYNLDGMAEYIAPGCVSDHTLSVVSFLEPCVKKKKTIQIF